MGFRSAVATSVVAVLAGSAMVASGGTSSATTPASADIHVGTFNISNLAFDSRAAGEHQVWKKRRPVIRKQILSQGLDVVGLQEANPSSVYKSSVTYGVNQYMDLLNAINGQGAHYALTNEYEYNCVKSTSSKNCVYQDRGASQDTRILYNTDTLTMLSQGSYKYNAQTAGKQDRYLDWAVFQTNANGRKFLFVNTHLDPASIDSRKQEWSELIDKTNQLKQYMPVMVVGDFNTSKYDDYAATYLPAMKSAGYGDVLNQQYATNPSNNPRPETMTNAWVNSFGNFRRNVEDYSYYKNRNKIGNGIDWVFASNNLEVKNYDVAVPMDAQTLQIKGVIPSDHNLVTSTIVLPPSGS
jgi:endonuclease/exonuclease/phosphatase family metal-dependent hydrolase